MTSRFQACGERGAWSAVSVAWPGAADPERAVSPRRRGRPSDIDLPNKIADCLLDSGGQLRKEKPKLCRPGGRIRLYVEYASVVALRPAVLGQLRSDDLWPLIDEARNGDPVQPAEVAKKAVHRCTKKFRLARRRLRVAARRPDRRLACPPSPFPSAAQCRPGKVRAVGVISRLGVISRQRAPGSRGRRSGAQPEGRVRQPPT